MTKTDTAPAAAEKTDGDRRTWCLLLAAWMIALCATLGALFIGEIMGQAPCVLCWFQRAFMFPLAVILLVACVTSDMRVWRYALPLAAIGWVVALYHALLYGGVIPEPIEQCGAGPSCASTDMTILGWAPIPVLSVIAFSAILVLLVIARRRSP